MSKRESAAPGNCRIKQITIGNLLEGNMPVGFPALTADSWVEHSMEPQLSQDVPPDIVSLFEVARGAMVYGWFFYPLITLAAEQCSRVIESGVRACCIKHGIPTRRIDKNGRPLRTKNGSPIETTYSENLNNLTKAKVIPVCDADIWNSARELRNLFSHPERQIILPPGVNLSILQMTSDQLNELFRDKNRQVATRKTKKCN